MLPVSIVVLYDQVTIVRKVDTWTDATKAMTITFATSGTPAGRRPTATSTAISTTSAVLAGHLTTAATRGRRSVSATATPAMNATIGGTCLAACAQCPRAASTPSSTTLPLWALA